MVMAMVRVMKDTTVRCHKTGGGQLKGCEGGDGGGGDG